jgi:hypothetical protein
LVLKRLSSACIAGNDTPRALQAGQNTRL